MLEISKEGQITLNPDVYPEIVERSGGGFHVTELEDRLELLAKAMSGEPLVQLLVAH
ncbi:hypothetical protein N9165_01230 [Akkermansiaceae bacterium]|nr:hypothetical protein [Akkermansiaceae bacterium]